MSNANAHMEQVKRERRTEEKVRALDAADIVEWIHRLEDEITDLEETADYLEGEMKEALQMRD